MSRVLQAGASASAAMTLTRAYLFDDFKIARPEGDCIPCQKGCTHILWDEKPSCLKLTFEGFGNGPCMLWDDWEGCHCLNRTVCMSAYGSCTWRVATVWADYCFNSTSLYTGGIAYWEAEVRYTDEHYWLYLTLYAGYLGARTTYWRADLGEEKPEAMTLDVTDFELVVDQVSDICDLSNVTLHIEAVDGDSCPPQQNRCLACGPQCGEYPPEIRLRTSGFGGANDGDFILGPGFVDWYHDECVWSYSGDVTWYVRFIYDRQSPSINVFVDHGGYWDGVYGTQTLPIDCSNLTHQRLGNRDHKQRLMDCVLEKTPTENGSAFAATLAIATCPCGLRSSRRS